MTEPEETLESEKTAVTEAASDEREALVRERDDYKSQLQRVMADFANYQKRARAQVDADRAYAVGNLAADLLGVIDNLERALEAARTTGESSIVDGLMLVHRQLLDVLAKHGVKPIEAVGQPFDPNQHEAIIQTPSADHPEGTVVTELARGYTLGDRVLRPTKVAVSTPAAAE
ncbi:MAG: nucleotide exchange factor GrpE [Isosphaeraceae bacterium]|jgi:molecular chaperone GrpE|nr:MAG: nucleotide exchange factor GrpE [Isosphaeraceae bacterium]